MGDKWVPSHWTPWCQACQSPRGVLRGVKQGGKLTWRRELRGALHEAGLRWVTEEVKLDEADPKLRGRMRPNQPSGARATPHKSEKGGEQLVLDPAGSPRAGRKSQGWLGARFRGLGARFRGLGACRWTDGGRRGRAATSRGSPAQWQGLELTSTWVQFSALKFSSCETLGKPMCFSKPQVFSSVKWVHFWGNFRQ